MAKKKSDRKNKNFGDAVGISNIISSKQADYILGGILAVASIFSLQRISDTLHSSFLCSSCS